MANIDSALLGFNRLYVNGDIHEVSSQLAANPSLGAAPAIMGVTRQDESSVNT